MMGKLIDLTGEKFGKLTVLERSSENQEKKQQIYWDCQCECGKRISVLGTNLKSGKTTSCGCTRIKRNKPVYKKCRYESCEHSSKDINIATEEYTVVSNRYYHIDCFKKKEEEGQKKARIKADVQLIKNLWLEHISNTVVYQQLYRCLNDLLDKGIESEYLVFTMEYCIQHHLNLRYPMGFKYFVDKQEIKDAYARKKLAEKRIDPTSFTAVTDKDNSSTFAVKKNMSFTDKIYGGK